MTKTIKIVVLAVTVSAVFELSLLRSKFPRYTPAVRSAPIELAKLGPVRIGAVRGHHGTSFVRLSTEHTVVQRWSEGDSVEVARQTREQLRVVPIKALGEFVAYAFLLAVGTVALSVAWRRSSAPLLRATSAAFVCAAIVLALEAPVLLGYGSSMYSTWVGVGSYSHSFLTPRVTFIPGETVAHRTLLEAINLIPLRAIEGVARPLKFVDAWIESPTSFSGMVWRSVGFWAIVAFISCWAVNIVLPRPTASSSIAAA